MEDYLFTPDAAAATEIAASASNDEPDIAIRDVLEWFRKQPNLEDRFGYVIRQSIDEVLDGQRTGRYNIDELEKTEKTYLGTKVEIVTRTEFNLGHGARMDYLAAGHELDSKFTIGGNWTIPHEANGHICLLVKANDHRSSYQVGLLRIRDEYLNLGRNRDGKRTPSAAGRAAIEWIIPSGRIPENTLLALPESERQAIFHASAGYRGSGNGGQLRTNELFRRVQERPVNRNTVLTVASQDDGPKRVRDARKHLRPEGILILGHQNQHPHIARDLDLPVPGKGSWVSVRVTPADNTGSARKTTRIRGRDYMIWREGDPAPAAPPAY
ncbi:NaeI family type II restriction endonuclease [Streptomyces sp. KN37]|uniref:NaeI family type II restriction endonuclease n=1 Tax=Streptomyces sp. KN37 TaxID=3090667 RepID=UPI002A75947D|nr:NaeI family type II restriction endonuclease [Streptomyces sp. KN37]WPO73554.1 NaeI family type II restriction endonuclease [Streptomyces sp. KN37]